MSCCVVLLSRGANGATSLQGKGDDCKEKQQACGTEDLQTKQK